MSKIIRISEDVYTAIQKSAIPLEDTPDSVLRRWAEKLGYLRDSNVGGRPVISGGIQSKGGYIRENPPKNIESITEIGVISYLIKYLQDMGGSARTKDAELGVFKMLEKVFRQEHYQINHKDGTPRWKKYIHWARDKAKNRGLIKKPNESGRGIWELTEKGQNY